MARKNEEDDLRSQIWITACNANEYPPFLQMAIKMPSKVEHEIER
jgi:hypothetical protein